MNLLTLSILCAIGIASRGSYDEMRKEHDNGNFHLYLEKHLIRALIGIFLSIGILVYTFVHYKWWYPLIMLIVSGLSARIFSIILSKIVGIGYSRLVQIWVMPIIAIIYSSVKLFGDGDYI